DTPLEAIGKPHLLVIIQLISFLIMPLSFLIGASYGGLLGATLAWATGYPIFVLARLWISLRALGLSYTSYLRCLIGPVMGGGIMYIMVMLTRYLIVNPLLPPIPGLICLIAIGIITYMSSMWLLRRRDCHEFLDLAQLH